jgi:hypothetical protein
MMTKATHAQGKVRHPTFGQGVGPCSTHGVASKHQTVKASKGPLEVLRPMLAIKPEDAKEVRDDVDEKADPRATSCLGTRKEFLGSQPCR